MKKSFSIILTVSLLLSILLLAGCGGNENNTTVSATGEDSEESATYEIALITGINSIDDKSFNAGTWDGVTSYAESRGLTCAYYTPASETTAEYLASIGSAVSAGAKVVVAPGAFLATAVYEAQNKYPNVKFILLDAEPVSADGTQRGAAANTSAIMYSEEESGYLAGYAAVRDGYTYLGFLGATPLPSIQAFGYGYLQGAETAAKELKLEDGAINVVFRYAGSFEETDDNKVLALTMYESGVEVIFACGGEMNKSVISAAEQVAKKVIGVDVDMRSYSRTVITSALKGLSASVKLVLASIYETNTFETYSGKTTYFNAANGGTGLPSDSGEDGTENSFDRFSSFDKSAYDEVLRKLASGNVTPLRTVACADASGNATAQEITAGLSLVKIKLTTV